MHFAFRISSHIALGFPTQNRIACSGLGITVSEWHIPGTDFIHMVVTEINLHACGTEYLCLANGGY